MSPSDEPDTGDCVAADVSRASVADKDVLLEALLTSCPHEAMALSEEDEAWLRAGPIGLEVL